MKKYVVLLMLCVLNLTIKAQSLYFPPANGTNWDSIPPASLGWCPDKIDSLMDYLDAKNTKAFILLKDGKIVLENYFGNFTRDSIWYWASAGKSLTSFMVGLAQQEGFLSIYDTTSHYIGQGWTSCLPAEEEKITIRHQLTMTSGMDDGGDPYCTDDTCLHCIADPGTRWAYHNAPYTLLDSVIASATGVNLNTYVYQKLSNQTGIYGLFIKTGYNNVFYSKARTMARFGLLMLNHGNWNGNQIMTDSVYFHDMINTSQNINLSYGYLWWLNGKASYMLPGLQFVFNGPLMPDAPADMFAALGKNGQFINVVPSQNMVFIRMGEAPGGLDVPATLNDSIWMKLNEVMCSSTSSKSMDELQAGLQIYPNPANDICRISFSEKDYSLRVLDCAGRMVLQKNHCAQETIFHTYSLSPGIYTLSIDAGHDRVLRRKMMIQR